MCKFPNCDFETNIKSKIQNHHIKPKEVDPSKSNKVTIELCPTCHSQVFHPEAKHGQHSIKAENSIHIYGVLKSTIGESVHYLDYSDNKEKYYYPRTIETWIL